MMTILAILRIPVGQLSVAYNVLNDPFTATDDVILTHHHHRHTSRQPQLTLVLTTTREGEQESTLPRTPHMHTQVSFEIIHRLE